MNIDLQQRWLTAHNHALAAKQSALESNDAEDWEKFYRLKNLAVLAQIAWREYELARYEALGIHSIAERSDFTHHRTALDEIARALWPTNVISADGGKPN